MPALHVENLTHTWNSGDERTWNSGDERACRSDDLDEMLEYLGFFMGQLYSDVEKGLASIAAIS